VEQATAFKGGLGLDPEVLELAVAGYTPGLWARIRSLAASLVCGFTLRESISSCWVLAPLPEGLLGHLSEAMRMDRC
jgi:hypothetical protein